MTTQSAAIDADLAAELGNNGYLVLRRMPDGHIAGINKFLFTYGLCTRVDFTGYHARWCYECAEDALEALFLWDGVGDPPGPWIKQKGPVERLNPLLFEIVGHNADGREIGIRKAGVDPQSLWPLPQCWEEQAPCSSN
jgi:hypothetical protein